MSETYNNSTLFEEPSGLPAGLPKSPKPASLCLADLFCGAGGTSTGAAQAAKALGYNVRITAVNHWTVAVATHTANHPEARHLCASIDSTNPRDLFAEGELDGLLASPECMGHSVALGGRPVNDQSRSTAWCVLRWLDALRPSFALIENVPEFQNWAPLGANGRPLKSRKGEVFRAWLDAVRALGYKVDYREFVAANYGDPTTRRRLFIQAVRGRRKIVWPHPTHAPIGSPTLFAARPWVAARDIIDWTHKGTSIFSRKRPLSEKTLARIQEGLQKFGGIPFLLPQGGGGQPRPVSSPSPTVACDGAVALLEPFIIPNFGERDGQSPRVHSIDDPIPAVTGRGAGNLIQPFLIHMEHGGRVLSVGEPMPTITTAKGGAFGVASPFLIQVNHGNGTDPNGNARRVRGVDQPLPTVCGNRGEWAICEPFVISAGGPTCDARPVSQPLGTVLTRDHRALVEPFLVTYYGNGEARSVGDPLDTVTTKDRFGLVQPIIETNGERYRLEVLFRMLQPRELAGAQGFPKSYIFTGTKTQVTKQIGNAVPRRLARALVAAIVSQKPDVSWIGDDEPESEAA